MRSLVLAAAVVVFPSISCKGATPSDAKGAGDAADTNGFAFTSPAFVQGAPIPSKHTCEGEDLSPELDWKGAPATAKSFAVIVDDPDAPKGTWTHWVIFDVPGTATKLAEGSKGVGVEGKTSWDRTGWGGPCPPSGTHHYEFKLYALDVPSIGKPAGATREEVEAAMSAHVVGRAALMGTYEKQKQAK
jgi:Raf kinase inhibitor-like YbhB/YbcL family protein